MWGFKITPTEQSSEIVIEVVFKAWNWEDVARIMNKLERLEED